MGVKSSAQTLEKIRAGLCDDTDGEAEDKRDDRRCLDGHELVGAFLCHACCSVAVAACGSFVRSKKVGAVSQKREDQPSKRLCVFPFCFTFFC